MVRFFGIIYFVFCSHCLCFSLSESLTCNKPVVALDSFASIVLHTEVIILDELLISDLRHSHLASLYGRGRGRDEAYWSQSRLTDESFERYEIHVPQQVPEQLDIDMIIHFLVTTLTILWHLHILADSETRQHRLRARGGRLHGYYKRTSRQ
jgi:hypothetical protein